MGAPVQGTIALLPLLMHDPVNNSVLPFKFICVHTVNLVCVESVFTFYQTLPNC